MNECAINQVIDKLYSEHWHGRLSSAPLHDKRAQLRKTLLDQTQGYWSDRTAYKIAVKGGFLIDSKRESVENGKAKPKKLTEVGKIFMASFEKKGE